MKKIVLSLLAVTICITSCFAFSACKSKKLVYGQNYAIESAEFMGFSGSTSDIKAYLAKVEEKQPDETNRIAPYIQLATRLSLSFEADGTGKLVISDLESLSILADVDENKENLEINNEVKRIKRALTDNGSIVNRNLTLAFDYTTNGKEIVIKVIHTGVTNFPKVLQAKDGNSSDYDVVESSENGDISLCELIKLFTVNTGSTATVENADKVATLAFKNGKIEMNLTLAIKAYATDETPGVYSELRLTLGR